MKIPTNYVMMLSIIDSLKGSDKRNMQRSFALQSRSKNRDGRAAGKRRPGHTGRMRLFGRTVYLNKMKEK